MCLPLGPVCVARPFGAPFVSRPLGLLLLRCLFPASLVAGLSPAFLLRACASRLCCGFAPCAPPCRFSDAGGFVFLGCGFVPCAPAPATLVAFVPALRFAPGASLRSSACCRFLSSRSACSPASGRSLSPRTTPLTPNLQTGYSSSKTFIASKLVLFTSNYHMHRFFKIFTVLKFRHHNSAPPIVASVSRLQVACCSVFR